MQIEYLQGRAWIVQPSKWEWTILACLAKELGINAETCLLAVFRYGGDTLLKEKPTGPTWDDVLTYAKAVLWGINYDKER